MEEKINILQLAPRYTFPPDDGGKIGIANITKEFSKAGADVTFFTFDDGSINTTDKELIAPYADLRLFQHSTSNTALRIFQSLFTKDSLYITKHYSKSIFRYLEELIKEKKFDAIHADHSAMAPLAIALKEKYGIPIGLRLHNIEWTIWQRYADILPRSHPKRIYIQSQANKLKWNEKKILEKIDVAFAITEEDKKRALELNPDLNVIVASAGVNVDEWQPDENTAHNPEELIIATTYHWQHNVDALKWFIENVMKTLKEEIPDIKLTLLGKNIPAEFHSYKKYGVEPVGYVEKVQLYLNKAGIYISPLFVGGGIRIKILEAMSMELPVVASPVAAEGIPANEDSGLFICNSADDFIATILSLISDKEQRDQAGKSARQYISGNFSWKKNTAKMLAEYLKLKKKIDD